MPKPYKKVIIAGDVKEEITYISGRKGLKIPVSPKMNETTDKQRKQNEKNAADKARWDINTNFKKGDWWATLNYPPNVRPTPAKVREDVDNFLKKMRKNYRAEKNIFKYVYTVGIGKRGAAHLHIVMNYIAAEKIADTWRTIVGTKETPYPVMKFTPLDGRKNHADLAAYLIKNSCETFYDTNKRVYAKRYCKSRLKKPDIRVIELKTKTFRKPRERKGYYMEKKYTYEGFTEDGQPYQHFTFVRLKSIYEEKGNEKLEQYKPETGAERRAKAEKNSGPPKDAKKPAERKTP